MNDPFFESIYLHITTYLDPLRTKFFVPFIFDNLLSFRSCIDCFFEFLTKHISHSLHSIDQITRWENRAKRFPHFHTTSNMNPCEHGFNSNITYLVTSCICLKTHQNTALQSCLNKRISESSMRNLKESSKTVNFTLFSFAKPEIKLIQP